MSSSPQNGTGKTKIAPAMHVTPGPTSVSVGHQDGVVVVHIEHATGSTILPIPAAMAEKVAHDLAGHARQATSGLVIPDLIPPKDIGGAS